MGPIRLDEWGPPMEEVVYILLARNKDKFSLIYVDQCTKSDDVGFFTKNPRFKCWMNQAGSENNLYVAVHPMFGSSAPDRIFAVGKIISKYSPHCNMEPAPEQPKENSTSQPTSESSKEELPLQDSIKCPCCGSDMNLERELQQSNLYKCQSCGISDTRLK